MIRNHTLYVINLNSIVLPLLRPTGHQFRSLWFVCGINYSIKNRKRNGQASLTNITNAATMEYTVRHAVYVRFVLPNAKKQLQPNLNLNGNRKWFLNCYFWLWKILSCKIKCSTEIAYARKWSNTNAYTPPPPTDRVEN